jgi:hypothetical protein
MLMTTTMMTITAITLHGGATWTKLQTASVNESFTVDDAEKHGGTVFSSLVENLQSHAQRHMTCCRTQF